MTSSLFIQKTTFFLFTFITASLLTVIIYADSASPQFKDYPVSQIYKGPNAPAHLSSPEAREFRTRLKEAARQKPNFAGHYIVAKWGCGSGCIMPAILDAKTGKVFMVPFTISTVGEEVVDPLQFRLDSRLLIANGSRNDAEENGTFYYRWDENRLTLLQAVMKK